MAVVGLAASLTFAVPASAHTNYCGGGDHWMRHGGKYLMKYTGDYRRSGRTIHIVEKWTNRTLVRLLQEEGRHLPRRLLSIAC